MTSPLEQLQNWFNARCNGAWEHQWGVRIETLDNPGWLVRIDLTGTPWEDRVFPLLKQGIDEVGSPTGPRWIHCFTQDKMFLGAADPGQLNEVLRLFLDWVGQADR